MKIEITWAVHSEATFRKKFEYDELPEEVKALLEEHDDRSLPYDEDLMAYLDGIGSVELDGEDRMIDFEDMDHEIEYSATQRYITGLRQLSPTREELGIPGVVHVSEVLDTVDEALEAGDDYRDAKEQA